MTGLRRGPPPLMRRELPEVLLEGLGPELAETFRRYYESQSLLEPGRGIAMLDLVLHHYARRLEEHDSPKLRKRALVLAEKARSEVLCLPGAPQRLVSAIEQLERVLWRGAREDEALARLERVAATRAKASEEARRNNLATGAAIAPKVAEVLRVVMSVAARTVRDDDRAKLIEALQVELLEVDAGRALGGFLAGLEEEEGPVAVEAAPTNGATGNGRNER